MFHLFKFATRICRFHAIEIEIHLENLHTLGKKCSEWKINGNFRILKWRYVSTIFLAIFCGDISLKFRPENRPYKALYGKYLQFRFLRWPLRKSIHWSTHGKSSHRRRPCKRLTRKLLPQRPGEVQGVAGCGKLPSWVRELMVPGLLGLLVYEQL